MADELRALGQALEPGDGGIAVRGQVRPSGNAVVVAVRNEGSPEFGGFVVVQSKVVAGDGTP